MDTLPVEMRSEIGKYLTFGDLKVMRLVSSTWNDLAKYKIQRRRRGSMTFFIATVERLAQFNDTFVNYQPMEELALAEFFFMLPVLASDEVSAHLDTFGRTFGQSVTSLTLYFEGNKRSAYWLTSEEREAIDRNVTLLLSKVKSQLQTLELKDYIGMSPSVLGTDTFPALTTLKVNHTNDLHVDQAAAGRVAAIQESCVLELSQKAPAIQEFDFGYYDFGPSDDPAYLATVLRYLFQANPEVRCKLNLRLPTIASSQSLKFVQELTQVDTRIIQMEISVPREGVNREDVRLLLQYVEGQSNCLRKLTLAESWTRRRVPRALDSLELRLPRMRILEELSLFDVTPTAADDDTANWLPNLRHVTMAYSGNDLALTFPSVTHLTLFDLAPETESAGEDFRRFISNFPNLWSLDCSIRLLAFPATFTQANLTRLKILDVESELWDTVNKGLPKLSFDQIVDLDVTPGVEAQGESFKDLGNLRELILTVCFPMEEELNAVLYISKIGKLKRLHKLCFEIETIFRPEAADNKEVTTKYLLELRKHHDAVEIVPSPPSLRLTKLP